MEFNDIFVWSRYNHTMSFCHNLWCLQFLILFSQSPILFSLPEHYDFYLVARFHFNLVALFFVFYNSCSRLPTLFSLSVYIYFLKS